jgi:hypothetical protein
MLRRASLLALPLASVLSLGLLAGSAAATGSEPNSRIVTLTIRGVDMNGHPEQIVVGQYVGYGETGGQGGLTSGPNELEAGRYAIAVEVPTLNSQGDDIASTLIARNVTVEHNMTLTLSAQHGVPVQISLNGVPQDDVMANVCASTGPAAYGVIQVLSDAIQGPPPLYVVPYRSSTLRFVYQATSIAADRTEYNLAGSFAGLPVKPVASFTTAGLAKVSLRVTAGAVRPWSGDAGFLLFSPGGPACRATQSQASQSVLDPSVTTEYFSPGTWLPTYIPSDPDVGSVGDTLTDTYAAGRSYSDTFYGAAFGPDYYTPSAYPVARADTLGIDLTVNCLFSDPAGGVADPDAGAVVSLASDGRTLALVHMANLNRPYFRHVVHRSGWYALSVVARRRHAAALLSPEVTVRWRFYASLAQQAEQFPVSYTQYRVGGLNLDNQAAPDTRTTIGVFVTGPSGAPNSGRAWREVMIQASFNGGRSWQALRLRRRGRLWTLSFREPSDGTVSLRSTVIGARGDSTVQTIYDAYNIG